MIEINGKAITLTRGDTARISVEITDADGEAYTPQTGDVVQFVCKKTWLSSESLITKTIPTDTLELELEPEDTAELPFDSYVYDIKLTNAGGDVDTFISKGILTISEGGN